MYRTSYRYRDITCHQQGLPRCFLLGNGASFDIESSKGSVGHLFRSGTQESEERGVEVQVLRVFLLKLFHPDVDDLSEGKCINPNQHLTIQEVREATLPVDYVHAERNRALHRHGNETNSRVRSS